MDFVMLSLILFLNFAAAADADLTQQIQEASIESIREYLDNPVRIEVPEFDPSSSEFLRRRMKEMEETEDFEYYLYDENPEGKCVDGPMGDDKEDIIYTCTEKGVDATIYSEKGCKGDIVHTFSLTNDPNDEYNEGSYAECKDFDQEGPGVKHAIVNMKFKQTLPKHFGKTCPPDVYEEEKNKCVIMHDMEDEHGETRLIVTARSKIQELYAKFRKAKMSRLEGEELEKEIAKLKEQSRKLEETAVVVHEEQVEEGLATFRLLRLILLDSAVI